MRRIKKAISASVSLLFVLTFSACVCSTKIEEKKDFAVTEVVATVSPNTEIPIVNDVISGVEEYSEKQMSDEDIELIALVTMAEAEGECEEGKRLVIDTILNRVDSEYFPDTVYDVVYQPNQFSPMWNGRVECCEVREDICQLVREEVNARTNYDVAFFTAGQYSKYGVPMFQVENHYFSSYD